MGQAEIQEAAPPSPASNTLDCAHLSSLSGVVCPLADGGAAWLHDGSCMSRESHVQFCERLGVRLPGATHLVICCRPGNAEAAMARMRELMTRLGLELNTAKTRIARLPEESIKFFGINSRRLLWQGWSPL